MKKRSKGTIKLVVSLLICGVAVWHAVHYYSTGTYLEMFKWLQTGKAYVTVLYNLGLMLVLGTTLGFLLEGITSLIVYKVQDKESY